MRSDVELLNRSQWWALLADIPPTHLKLMIQVVEYFLRRDGNQFCDHSVIRSIIWDSLYNDIP